MYSVVYSGAVFGLESYLVKVEADASRGLPGFEMVGMPSGEVKEAKERVKVALKNLGYVFPPMHITVNLSPAYVKKSGTSFDLPIAISLLVSIGEIEQTAVKDIVYIGELGLNGEVEFSSGILPIVLKAREEGVKTCLVPVENVREGAVVEGIDVIGISSLEEAIDYTIKSEEERRGAYEPQKLNIDALFCEADIYNGLDYGDVAGQDGLKRASVIATAGFHHMLMVGPPGAGKTMIAKRLPSIMPKLSMEESLEVTKIYSIAGLLTQKQALMVTRPICMPHHTISVQALAGGGRIPKPGAVSLSHRGVLFLDEAVHFNNAAIEALRQPLEDKKVVISRSCGTVTYPADFMLLAAINPCPCGYYPDRNKCNCTEPEIKRYLSRISGPILDRIDICVEANKIELSQLNESGSKIDSNTMRESVLKAREIQNIRYANKSYKFNGEIPPSDIKIYCKLGKKEAEFMEKAYSSLELSARGYHKILKVARTIADLEGEENISVKSLAEAINYRTSGKKFW